MSTFSWLESVYWLTGWPSKSFILGGIEVILLIRDLNPDQFFPSSLFGAFQDEEEDPWGSFLPRASLRKKFDS